MTSWIGPAIVAAFISAAVTGLGWFVTRRHEALRFLALRQERVKDVQTAVLADIRDYLHRLQTFDLQDYAASMVERMEAAEQAGTSFTPFISAEVPSFIFEALVKDIQILPTHIVDPVVLYYTQLKAIAYIAEDMRSERFERLEISRRIAIYSDYVGLLIHARELGKDVVASSWRGSARRSVARSRPGGAVDRLQDRPGLGGAHDEPFQGLGPLIA